MSFPHRTSVRSSMQMNYSKEGIVFWLAVGGKGGNDRPKSKAFSLSQVSSPQKPRSKATRLLSIVRLLCGRLSPFAVHSVGDPDAAV